MGVQLDREIAEDLVSFKLRTIQREINLILTRWGETSIDNFVEKARNGTYEEAENDAIDLRQLKLEEEKLLNLKDQILR